MEKHFTTTGLEPFHDYCSACQGGMAAERHLRGRREPAQAIVAAFGDNKGRLGKVILGGNGLQHRVSLKAIHWHHRSGIASE
jgi:hypothetical protein